MPRKIFIMNVNIRVQQAGKFSMPICSYLNFKLIMLNKAGYSSNVLPLRID